MNEEDLIWWKQTAIRLIAFADLCTDRKLNELQAMLADVETRGWKEDEKAIELLIQLLEIYKEEKEGKTRRWRSLHPHLSHSRQLALREDSTPPKLHHHLDPLRPRLRPKVGQTLGAPSMHLDRMQWLIEAVQSAPDDNFNMEHWECGTSHCAGGWLCLDPRAQQLGLHLDNPRGIFLDPVPCYQDFRQFRALAVFLNISKPNTEYIFSPSFYKIHPIRKSTVLRHIRRVMVDEKERIVE